MSDDARRARRILAFRDELETLAREGVARLELGVLTLALPKAAEALTQQIPITIA